MFEGRELEKKDMVTESSKKAKEGGIGRSNSSNHEYFILYFLGQNYLWL